MARKILKKMNAAIHYTAMTIIGVLLLLFAVIAFVKIYDWWTFNRLQQFVKLPYVSTPTIAKITTNNDMYLVAYGPAESSLLVLHRDGTYETGIRMHMGSMNSDEGTWSVSDKGDIVLKSTQRFHDIYVDDILWIRVDKRVFSDLPEIKQSLVKLLKSSRDELLPYAQLAGIKEYQAKYGKIVVINSYTERPVKRDAIIKLIKNIEIYKSSTEQNIFYWRPVTYKSFLFLANVDNHYFSIEKLTNEIVTTIDNYRTNVPFAFSHHDVFAAITPEYFKYESDRPEPFKFVKMLCR